MNNIRNLCECGCGETPTPGKRFIRWHGRRKNPVVGRIFHQLGYPLTYMPGHSRADSKGYVREHVLVMEKSLGRPILKSESIHHIDGDATNYSIGNLMLFQSNVAHMAYHARHRAFAESGHYDWYKCRYCKTYDKRGNLYFPPGIETVGRHRECFNKYQLEAKRERRATRVKYGFPFDD